MEALQAYVFENGEDIKEIHYMKLMELILKAHKTIPVIYQPEIRRQPVIHQPVVFTNIDQPTRLIDDIKGNMRISRDFTISNETWVSELKSLLDNDSSFNLKLKSLHPFNIGWEGTHYIFPDGITRQEREKIHMMNDRIWNPNSQHFIVKFRTISIDHRFLHVFVR